MRFSIRIATIVLLLPNVADDVRGEVKVMVPGCVMVGAFPSGLPASEPADSPGPRAT